MPDYSTYFGVAESADEQQQPPPSTMRQMMHDASTSVAEEQHAQVLRSQHKRKASASYPEYDDQHMLPPNLRDSHCYQAGYSDQSIQQ